MQLGRLLSLRPCAEVPKHSLGRFGEEVGNRSARQLRGVDIQYPAQGAIGARDASVRLQQHDGLGKQIEGAEDFR